MSKQWLISLMLLSGLTSGVAVADTDISSRTIRVQGNGQVLVAPNTAVLQIAVETNDVQANAAVTKNARQMAKVVDVVKQRLTSDDRLATSRYHLEPVYQYDQTQQRSLLTGYQVTNYLTVTTKHLDKLGQLLDSAAQAGANRIDNLQFSHDKISQYQQDALAAAVADAEQTARVLAKAAGVRLGSVQKIQPQQNNIMPMMSLDSAKRVMGRENTPIEPGQLLLSVSVAVVYAMSP